LKVRVAERFAKRRYLAGEPGFEGEGRGRGSDLIPAPQFFPAVTGQGRLAQTFFGATIFFCLLPIPLAI
jgi:hypothetical protein